MNFANDLLSIFAEENCVSTALFGEVCDACNGGGINFALMYTIEAMIFGIGILAVTGLLVFGIQYLTAGSNSGQTAKAKGRLRNMLIGVITYVALIAGLQFLMPGGIKSLVTTTADSCPEKRKTEIDVIEPKTQEEDFSGGGGTSGDATGDNSDGQETTPVTINDRLEVHFVSANGYYDDTIILRNKDGAILIDGGRMKSEDLLAYIKGIGITSMNYMIGSHIEKDHVAVQKAIASEMNVKRAYYPVDPRSCSPWCDIGGKNPLVEAMSNGLSITLPVPGSTSFSIGSMKVYFIGSDKKTWGTEANYSSIVNLVKYGSTTFMFTGDKEDICGDNNVSLLHSAAAKFGFSSLKVDVYKWPHHGNAPCKNRDFLKELSPKFAIVPNNGASWSVCKESKCLIAKGVWGSETEWLAMKSYKYVVFVSDGKTIKVEYNKEPSYWANYWK